MNIGQLQIVAIVAAPATRKIYKWLTCYILFEVQDQSSCTITLNALLYTEIC